MSGLTDILKDILDMKKRFVRENYPVHMFDDGDYALIHVENLEPDGLARQAANACAKKRSGSLLYPGDTWIFPNVMEAEAFISDFYSTIEI